MNPFPRDPALADDLLKSAIRHLTEQDPGYSATYDWSHLMTAAHAKEQAKAMKAAAKKIAAEGVIKHKHHPRLEEATLQGGECAPGLKAIWPNTGIDTPPQVWSNRMSTPPQPRRNPP